MMTSQQRFFTVISRNTQSKSYVLSLTECVWDFQSNVLWDTHSHTLLLVTPMFFANLLDQSKGTGHAEIISSSAQSCLTDDSEKSNSNPDTVSSEEKVDHVKNTHKMTPGTPSPVNYNIGTQNSSADNNTRESWTHDKLVEVFQKETAKLLCEKGGHLSNTFQETHTTVSTSEKTSEVQSQGNREFSHAEVIPSSAQSCQTGESEKSSSNPETVSSEEKVEHVKNALEMTPGSVNPAEIKNSLSDNKTEESLTHDKFVEVFQKETAKLLGEKGDHLSNTFQETHTTVSRLNNDDSDTAQSSSASGDNGELCSHDQLVEVFQKETTELLSEINSSDS